MLSLLALLNPAVAQDALPVRRIRFYETGVAWFERSGRVGTQSQLPLPTSHLDDALKSLVVLEGGVDLAAITFASAPAQDAARADAGLHDGERIPFADALRALQGLPLTVRTETGEHTGVLLDVEGPLAVAERGDGDATPTDTVQVPHFALTLLGADGTLHRMTTEHLTGIQSDDTEVTERLRIAAGTLVANRAQRSKAMGLQLEQAGRLAIGYVAEAPVWRVSYRITDPGPDALLAGWALVHNTTSEPWLGVQVELANGEPDSFLYPLAAPRYADRELVTPPRELATVAQLATATVDEMWKVSRGMSVGASASGYGSGGGGFGAAGVGLGRVQTGTITGGAAPPPIETPSQFVYVVGRPVDLPAHHSALVPMLRSPLHAEEVVVFAQGRGARSAVWVENTTDQTLPMGVVSVVQQGGLAGEARLERLKPTETQMVPFGNERDVLLERRAASTEDRAQGLTYEAQVDLIALARARTTTHHVELRNRSARSRQVWVGMDIAREATVEDDLRTELDRQTGQTYVVLEAPAGVAGHDVVVAERDVQHFTAEAVTVAQWEAWRDARLGDDGLLGDLQQLRRQLDAADARTERDRAALRRSQAELDGLRTSIQAASDDAAPLTRRAATVEQELRRMGERQAEADRDRAALVSALRLRARDLAPDATQAALTAP